MTSRHGESWSLLQHLATQCSLPWVCLGDFNELLTVVEKKGCLTRSESQMKKFRDTLGVCGLRDLGFRGSPYTWCNQRLGTARTFERLDRCVATVVWQQCFTRYEVSHIIPPVSDHLMLKLETILAPLACTPKRRPPIRFKLNGHVLRNVKILLNKHGICMWKATVCILYVKKSSIVELYYPIGAKPL